MRDRQARPRARIARLLLSLVLAPALAGCLLDPVAPTPPPPTPRPTPSPTPTPTAQARVVYPTAVPTPTPTPTPVAELRGAGQLLYTGALGGRTGIIVADADGGARRLVVEGRYQQVAWSPDGRRFAATSATGETPVATRVELFDAGAVDGPPVAPLQRADFGRVYGLSWSPDSRHVAVTGVPAGDRARELVTWTVDETAVIEHSLGRNTDFRGWSPDGHLVLAVATERDNSSLWLAGPDGRGRQRLAEGRYAPLAWTPDGGTVYALGRFQPPPAGQSNGPAGLTALVALDTGTGAERTIATVADIAAQLDAREAPPRWFMHTVVAPPAGARAAPAGDRFALELRTERTGTPPTGQEVRYLVVLDTGGRLLAAEQTPPLGPGAPIGAIAWSPSGDQLAYGYGDRDGQGEVRVIAPRAGGPAGSRAALAQRTLVFDLQWSPDGRWLAATTGGGLVLAAAEPPACSWLLAGNGFSGSWRPRNQP